MEVKLLALWIMRCGSTAPLLLPPRLVFFLPLQHHIGGPAFPKALLQSNSFITLLFIFDVPVPISGQTTPAAPWDIPASSSCSSLQSLSFALICPRRSAITGRGSLSRSVIVEGAIHIFGTKWGIGSQSMSSAHTLSEKNNMVLSRQPGNHKRRGIPAFVLFDEELNRC